MTSKQFAALRRYIKEHGYHKTAADAGVAEMTLRRVVDSGRVHPGSKLMVEKFASDLPESS